jgi:2-oxoglutarate/2-oxoacid ferredoxin oxidoreductase subunit alpha
MSEKKNSSKMLMKGNEALAEGAIIAGCRYYFGYPITPQNEIPAYMSRRMPQVGGTFIQSESEIAAANMVFGAAAAGARTMTSSSSPGISLKQEAISYMAGAQLPCVIVNVQRAGPGLGGIGSAQGDYFQAVKGGGHGDYRLIVLAPSSVQEMADFAVDAFDYADIYRTPVMILSDATVGQMMEPLVLPAPSNRKLPEKTWALTGAKGRPANVIHSYYRTEEGLFKLNIELQKTYERIGKEIVRYEEFMTDDAEFCFVAYGISARIAKSVVKGLREEGIRAGLFRPITLWPFPSAQLAALASKLKFLFVIEMSMMGQMVEDVRLAVCGKCPVEYYGIAGGYLPYEFEIRNRVHERLKV